MVCRVVEQDCKRSTERRPRGFDITHFCTRYWEKGSIVASGVSVRPMPKAYGGKRGVTGFEYEVTTAGQFGEVEPEYPTTPGATVASGSAVLTCRVLSNASLARVISNVTWEVTDPDSTMVVDDDDIINTDGVQQLVAYHSLGEEGDETLVVAHVTMDDGSVEDFGINWSIHDTAEEEE